MSRKTLRIFFVPILLLLAGKTIAQKPTTKLFDNRSSVELWLKENKVPALGLGIIKEGRLQEIRMYGELKPGTPAPYNALFNVASLTKPVVAMITLKLVSSGAWNLDEPLSNYWVDPDIAGDPRHKKLTTRIVLSHQTGFKNWRFLNTDGKLAFECDPGTKFGYSGEGFEYLRRALEKKFNQPLARLADSLVFAPLSMHDTQLAWDQRTDETRFAHWFDTSGSEHRQDYKTKNVNAADDLLTTVEDYGKFAVSVMNGGGLAAPVFQEMIRPQVPTKGGLFMGLGWELFKDLGPRKEYVITHSGSDHGVKSLVILLPESRQGLIVFANSDNGYKLYEKAIVELLDVGKDLMDQAK